MFLRVFVCADASLCACARVCTQRREEWQLDLGLLHSYCLFHGHILCTLGHVLLQSDKMVFSIQNINKSIYGHMMRTWYVTFGDVVQSF